MMNQVHQQQQQSKELQNQLTSKIDLNSESLKDQNITRGYPRNTTQASQAKISAE